MQMPRCIQLANKSGWGSTYIVMLIQTFGTATKELGSDITDRKKCTAKLVAIAKNGLPVHFAPSYSNSGGWSV